MTAALILSLLIKSSVVAGLALALSALMKNRPATERVEVLRAATVLLIALPFAVLFGPDLSLAWLPAATAAPAEVVVQTWAVDLQPVAPVSVSGALAPPSWELVAGLAYVAGLIALSARFAVGVWTLNRWTETARPVTASAWTQALQRLDPKGRTRLRVSMRVDSPLCWGPPPGVILIGEDCLARPQVAPAVLAHEMAHVRRADWPFLILSRLSLALFWFNPLAWLLHAALIARSDEAADAAAVCEVDRRLYARALVDLAGDAPPAAALGMAAGDYRHLSRRIARLMKTPSRTPARPGVLALAVGALVAVATPLAAVELTQRAPETAAVAAVSASPPLAALAPVLAVRTAQDWSVPPVPPAPPAPPAPPEPPAPLAGFAQWSQAAYAPPPPPAPPPGPPPPAPPAPPAPPVPPPPPPGAQGVHIYRGPVDPEARRAIDQARAQASEAREHARVARAEAARVRAQTRIDHAAVDRARTHALAAARDAQVHAREAQVQARHAQEQARHAMARARVDMGRGADQMDRGAEQMREEARRLRDPAYRARQIEENRARGSAVTDAELVALSRRLPEQADEMQRQAQRMREQSFDRS